MMFWGAALGLAMVTAAALMWPLLRQEARLSSRDSYDCAVYRDQLTEVGRDVARGVLEPGDAEVVRTEIARRLLRVAPLPSAPPPDQPQRWRRLGAVAVGVLVPVVAVALYLPLGRPDLPSQPLKDRPRASGIAAPSAAVQKAIENLRQHVIDSPEDGPAWELLGRTELTLGNTGAGVSAYGKAHALAPGDAGLTSAYAAALTFSNQGLVPPQAQGLFAEALKEDASDPQARFYLAEARAQAGDLEGAFVRLMALAKDTPADASYGPSLRQRLIDVAGQLGRDPGIVGLSPPGDTHDGVLSQP